LDVEAKNLARFAFGKDFERAAADFAIGCEALLWNGGIDDQVEALSAKRTLD